MIPIYRAKKIDSDEYVEGYLFVEKGDSSNGDYPKEFYHILDGYMYDNPTSWTPNSNEIYQSTLSINFKDMIDSESTKIFASLNEDGKGGDIIEYSFFVGDKESKSTDTALFCGIYGMTPFHVGETRRNPKVIGIQQ